MAMAKKVHSLQVSKARGADFAFICLVASVRDEKDTKLALGRFDGDIYFARRDVEAPV
jgi:hypothetical protein